LLEISEYFISFRVAAASAAKPAQENVRLIYEVRHGVSDCDIPSGTASIPPWYERDTVRLFPIGSEKALWFFDGWESCLG